MYHYQRYKYKIPPEHDGNPSDDGDYPEIFSWYLVSDWLADKLQEQGECILRTEGGDYWGRQTFGQLIESDNVIETIYNDINK